MIRIGLVAVLVFAVALASQAQQEPQQFASWQATDCDHRILLPYTPPLEKGGAPAEATFFLDFATLAKAMGGAPDIASMMLYPGGDKTPIEFSLDYRYGDRERLPDEYVRPVTGYYGDKFPAAEGKLRRLGYLSFRPTPGQKVYALYFKLATTNAPLRDRPLASVRPWWVEGIADPEFRVDLNGDGCPDFYTWNAKGDGKSWRIAPKPNSPGQTCLQLTPTSEGTLGSAPNLLKVDSRVGGRRVMLYQQVYAEQTLTGRSMGVALPNAFRESGYAVLYYFGEIPARVWTEMCIEGRVKAGLDRYEARLNNTYNGPCYVGEIHLQFPPELAAANRIGIETDVAFPGDAICLTWQSGTLPYLYPMPLTVEHKDGRSWTIRAERVEEWTEGFHIEAYVSAHDIREPFVQVKDEAEFGVSWRRVLRLPPNLAPGRYRIRFEVKSRRNPPEPVACLVQDLRVLSGPFEIGAKP